MGQEMKSYPWAMTLVDVAILNCMSSGIVHVDTSKNQLIKEIIK